MARQNRHDEALRHYDRALALAPDFADAHCNRGISLNALRRFSDALAAYGRAIELAPAHGDAWRNRGVSLNNLNRYDDAIASYDRAEARTPRRAGTAAWCVWSPVILPPHGPTTAGAGGCANHAPILRSRGSGSANETPP